MLAVEPEKWSTQGIVWGFVIAGMVIAGAGLIWILYTGWFLLRSASATGVVVEVVTVDSTRSPGESPNAKQVRSYYPVVEFQTEQGITHRIQSTRAARSADFKIGDQLQVAYTRSRPPKMMVRDPWMLWFSPGVILAGGLFWLLLSGAALLVVKRAEAELRDGTRRFLEKLPRD